MSSPMKKIFISQEVLDTLFCEEKASLNGDRLTLHSHQDQVYKLIPAFKFLYMEEGVEDPHGLVGKIYTKSELEKIRADIYMNSAIINEVAYQVEPGFIGRPEGSEKKKHAASEASDDELLSDYLLKIL